MYQALDHTQSGIRAVAPSRATSSSPNRTASRRAGVTSSVTGLGLRRKWNALRYVLLGTGPYAPPVGKFKV